MSVPAPGPGASVPLPVALPGGGTLTWLVPAVKAVLERAGGSSYRLSDEGLAALVTARDATDFDVVLELTAAVLTLRVWGLERAYPLPADDEDAAARTALRALQDWLSLLSGEARLVVYYRAGAACCWTVTDHDRGAHPDLGWHPRRPPTRLTRWLRRWRRRVLVNRFLDVDAAHALLVQAAADRAEHAAPLRAPVERGGRHERVPVAAA